MDYQVTWLDPEMNVLDTENYIGDEHTLATVATMVAADIAAGNARREPLSSASICMTNNHR